MPLVLLEARVNLMLPSKRPPSVAEHAVHIYIDLADERWRRKANNAAKTSSMPSVPRFARKRTDRPVGWRAD